MKNYLKQMELESITWGDEKSYPPSTLEEWARNSLNSNMFDELTKDKIAEMLFTYFINTNLDPKAKYFMEMKQGTLKLFRDRDYSIKDNESSIYTIITEADGRKCKSKHCLTINELKSVESVLNSHSIKHIIFRTK